MDYMGCKNSFFKKEKDLNTPVFIKEILSDEKLNIYDQAIYLELCLLKSDRIHCNISLLAEKIKITEVEVEESIKRLMEHGYLVVVEVN